MGLTVGSSRDKLGKQTAKLLEPGESLLAAAKMLPRGAGKRRAAGFLLFGVIGAHAAGSTAKPGTTILGRPLPGNLAVAVTDRRLLVLRLSEATDRVTELTHSVPIGYVAEVHSEVGKSVGMKAVRIALSFADGSAVSLKAVCPNTTDVERVARALFDRVRRLMMLMFGVSNVREVAIRPTAQGFLVRCR
jgi:hypothetical protein